MCGIAGIVATTPFDGRLLRQMSLLLRHRGPDDEGFALLNGDRNWKAFGAADTVSELRELPQLSDDQQSKIGLVHRRLSILDLSVHGHQPVISTDGKQSMVFNGEIYNYLELRKELQAAGFTFRSESDTEVVFVAIRHWGTEAFSRFRGMWAIAFADSGNNELIL